MNEFINDFLCAGKNKEKDLFRLRQKHYGFLNGEKTIYYINETNANLGFFAMYRYWLEYLYFADICGYTPVIDVGGDFAYCEKNAVNGTKNPFEYYFQQPATINVKQAMHSSRVIYSDIVHRQMVELILTGKKTHYNCNLRYMQFMGEIICKYLKYNYETGSFIKEGVQKIGIGNSKILGVHIRGTDFKKKYDNHPVFVTDKEIFKAVDNLLEKNHYEGIFVATDDEPMMKLFIKRYGNRMRYYLDVMRSSDMKSVIFHESSRTNHRYKLGLEVIRDMYTLSLCDGLVAGVSQVVICARINKIARREKYQDLVIIDKGINNNGRPFYRHN